MAQNIFEDLSRKPVARALWSAAAMTQLKLAFAVTHRSPIRWIWTNPWSRFHGRGTPPSFRGPRHTVLPPCARCRREKGTLALLGRRSVAAQTRSQSAGNALLYANRQRFVNITG